MDTNATTPNRIRTTREVNETVKNVHLEGEVLKIKKIITTYEVVKEISSGISNSIKILSRNKIEEKKETLQFPLVKVTKEMLTEYRKRGISSFVLKIEDDLFYTEIPENINFMSHNIVGPHKCAMSGQECNRLSAASDENGGCEKVRNRATCIERYPWIKKGFETFNTKHNVFCVGECEHYEKCPPRKRPTAAEINATRIGLAQFVWPDVETLGDVKKRVEKNKRMGNMRR